MKVEEDLMEKFGCKQKGGRVAMQSGGHKQGTFAVRRCTTVWTPEF